MTVGCHFVAKVSLELRAPARVHTRRRTQSGGFVGNRTPRLTITFQYKSPLDRRYSVTRSTYVRLLSVGIFYDQSEKKIRTQACKTASDAQAGRTILY